MNIYNKGYTFVREFQTIEEINEFCMRNQCEPLNITPFVVKDNYKAGGSTSAITSIIHEHHYAVILKPFSNKEQQNELNEFDKVENKSVENYGQTIDRKCKTDKAVKSLTGAINATKLKSNRPQSIATRSVEKEFGQTFSVTDILKQEQPAEDEDRSNESDIQGSGQKSRKTLNNIRYTDIADALHYSDKQKQLSKRWFETHPKDKPFDNYVTYMELQPWQIDILDVML